MSFTGYQIIFAANITQIIWDLEKLKFWVLVLSVASFSSMLLDKE